LEVPLLKKLAFLVITAALVLGLGGCALINLPPVVVISYTPTNPSESNDVFLDATNTTDSEGDTLTYTWSLPGVPDSSSSEIDDPDNPVTFFYADLGGDYDVRLVVSDGTNSVQADFEVWVSPLSLE
jgi:hypothetical protein